MLLAMFDFSLFFAIHRNRRFFGLAFGWQTGQVVSFQSEHCPLHPGCHRGKRKADRHETKKNPHRLLS